MRPETAPLIEERATICNKSRVYVWWSPGCSFSRRVASAFVVERKSRWIKRLSHGHVMPRRIHWCAVLDTWERRHGKLVKIWTFYVFIIQRKIATNQKQPYIGKLGLGMSTFSKNWSFLSNKVRVKWEKHWQNSLSKADSVQSVFTSLHVDLRKKYNITHIVFIT